MEAQDTSVRLGYIGSVGFPFAQCRQRELQLVITRCFRKTCNSVFDEA